MCTHADRSGWRGGSAPRLGEPCPLLLSWGWFGSGNMWCERQLLCVLKQVGRPLGVGARPPSVRSILLFFGAWETGSRFRVSGGFLLLSFASPTCCKARHVDRRAEAPASRCRRAELRPGRAAQAGSGGRGFSCGLPPGVAEVQTRAGQACPLVVVICICFRLLLQHPTGSVVA